jgi:hypothetical protein
VWWLLLLFLTESCNRSSSLKQYSYEVWPHINQTLKAAMTDSANTCCSMIRATEISVVVCQRYHTQSRADPNCHVWLHTNIWPTLVNPASKTACQASPGFKHCADCMGPWNRSGNLFDDLCLACGRTFPRYAHREASYLTTHTSFIS